MKPWVCLGVFGLSIFTFLWAGEPIKQPPLRMGIVGYEGHGSLFTKELNSGLGAKIGLVVTHIWNYVPHIISALVGAPGAGIEEIQAHDLSLDGEGITIRNPLLIFLRYGPDSDVGPVRGTLQMVPGGQPGDWYGFRMKLFGRKESPDYALFRTAEVESSWMPIYRLLVDFFRDGRRPISDQELLEVPLVLDMIKKSGLENRPVFRSEYRDIISLLD